VSKASLSAIVRRERRERPDRPDPVDLRKALNIEVYLRRAAHCHDLFSGRPAAAECARCGRRFLLRKPGDNYCSPRCMQGRGKMVERGRAAAYNAGAETRKGC
jgi:hypothetical protein